RCGLDPTAVIGGRVSAFGGNARLGRGEFMGAGGDESDRSFLELFPTIAVVTNIDHEHLGNYGGVEEPQGGVFHLANKNPVYGGVVACLDDANLAQVLPKMTRRVITYGLLSPDAEVTAADVELGPLTASATILRRNRRAGPPSRTSQASLSPATARE